VKTHRKWITVIGYCNSIPLNNVFVTYIRYLLKQGENVLVMIKKEEELYYTLREKFDAICAEFPNETKTGKLIVSGVPDIKTFVEMDF